jgi:hypothetical protein
MPTVHHHGLTIAAEHPALWVDGGEQIVRDLVDVFAHPRITAGCLQHLIANHRRLIAGRYALPDGRGCLMNVLTEPLGDGQIRSKGDLLRFFGRSYGEPAWAGHVAATDSPEYQPAKWLVRLVDGQVCDETRRRYGRACEFFGYELALAVAAQVLAGRKSANPLATGCPITNQRKKGGQAVCLPSFVDSQ